MLKFPSENFIRGIYHQCATRGIRVCGIRMCGIRVCGWRVRPRYEISYHLNNTDSGKFLRRERRADQARRAVIRRPGNEGIYHYPYDTEFCE